MAAIAMLPGSRTAVGIIAAVLLPASAAAQKAAFIDAFIEFHSALSGTYDKEGSAIRAAFERMDASLAVWEQTGRKAEASLKARAATPAEFALLYADDGRFDAAIRAMAEAIAAEPERASLYVFQGLLQEATGRESEAARLFAAAAARDPAHPAAAYLAASRPVPGAPSADLQPFVAALSAASDRPLTSPLRAPFVQFGHIDDLASREPMFSPASYADGFTLFSRGRYRDAVTQFRATLAMDPLVVDPAGRSVQALAGFSALREKRRPAAIEQLEANVRAFPRSSEAHRLLGVALREFAMLPASIGYFETAVRLAPRDERARVLLGSALAEADRLADAERVLRETITLLPSSGWARWLLATVYERLNRRSDALAELEEAASLTVVAGKTLLYDRIAELAFNLHDHDRVITAFTQRTRLAPNAPAPHKDLGFAYARIGRNDEALVELLMTTILRRADSGTLAAIGRIHLAGERFEDAERAARRAVAADEQNAQAQYVLGSTLMWLGRTEEGQEHLDEFTRLRAAELQEVQEVLERSSQSSDSPP